MGPVPAFAIIRLMKWTDDHRRNARTCAAVLRRLGYRCFTGVPCSLLGALIEELSRPGGGYVPSVREDAAIGLASGSWLAGRPAAVLMQNSGLGYSLNVLTSLNLIYRIPVLCLVSYRGLGPDAPEHLVMGRSCVALLKEVGIPTDVPAPGALPGALRRAHERIRRTRRPAAVFIRRGIFGS